MIDFNTTSTLIGLQTKLSVSQTVFRTIKKVAPVYRDVTSYRPEPLNIDPIFTAKLPQGHKKPFGVEAVRKLIIK